MGAVLGAGWLIALILARPALSLQIDYVDIQPSTNVKIGDEITITATLINDTGQLGSWDGILCAEPEPTCNQPSACGHWGQYSVFPDTSGVVAYPVPTETQSYFGGVINIRVSTQWKFTATRTGTVSFGVVAAQPAWWIYEGCSDPAGCGASGLPWDGSTCGLGPVTITSDLEASAEIHCISPGGRPAASAFPGDDFVVVLSLTNEGTADATVDYAACTSLVSPKGAFILTGSPSFPVTINPSNSAYFTWSYHVNADAPVPASLSFRTDANRILADTNNLNIVVPPVTLSVTLYIDPDGAGPLTSIPGGDGYYMAQDEITVLTTLTNISPDYDLDVDPTILSRDADGDGKPDFRPIGTRDPAPGAISLNRLTSRQFTWKYEVERGGNCYGWCRDTVTDPFDYHRYLVMARGIQQSVFQNVRKEIASVELESPGVVQMSKPFSVTVWVTSLADRPMVLDPSASIYLAAEGPGSGDITITGGPSWTGTRYFDAGERLPYVFNCAPAAEGNRMLSAWINYDVMLGFDWRCLSAPSVNVAVIPPSPFTATFTPNTTDVNSGHWYQLNLTATNDSKCDSTLSSVPAFDELSISPPFVFNNEVSGPFLTDCTPPCLVPAGESRHFSWSVTTTGCGYVDWTGTGTGDWTACGGAMFIMPFTSGKIRVHQLATLTPASVSVALPKSQVVLTRNFDVILTVVPAGQNDIKDFDVKPDLHQSSGAVVTPIVIPSIPAVLPGCGRCVVGICPDKSRSFTWTFRADDKGTGSGEVWFTFTVSGTDIYTSDPVGPIAVHSQPSQMRILKPSTLSAVAAVTRACDTCAPPVDGCGLQVAFNVGVDGDTPINGTYTLSAEPVSVSGGAAMLAKAPVLDGNPLSPGKAEFEWLYAPDAAGSISFTMSMVGTEAELGGPVYATATTASYTITPPSLVASASVYKGTATGDITVTTAPGQSFKVVLKVENQGDVPVDSVTATTTATGSALCAGNLPVVLPTTTVYTELNITGGQLKGCKTGVFFWNFIPGPDPDGVGIISYSVTLTGIAHDTKNPVSVSAFTKCLTVLSPPPAMFGLGLDVLPSVAIIGGVVEVRLTVTNTGGSDATGVIPSLMIDQGSSLVEYRDGPVPAGPVTLNPGACRTFTWSYLIAGAGAVVFKGTMTGVDSKSGSSFSASGTTTLTSKRPAALGGWLSADPVTTKVGGKILLMLGVTNTGGVAAANVTALLNQSSGNGTATLGGPYPIGRSSLEAGETVMFTWTATATHVGKISWTGRATATGGIAPSQDVSKEIVVQSPLPQVAIEPGGARMVGGRDGTVRPRHGEQAILMIWPTTAGVLRARVYDSEGNLLREITQATNGGNPELMVWNCRDSSDALVPPGTYRLFVEGPGITVNGPLAVLIAR